MKTLEAFAHVTAWLVVSAVCYGPIFFGGMLWEHNRFAAVASAAIGWVVSQLIRVWAEKATTDWTRNPRYRDGLR